MSDEDNQEFVLNVIDADLDSMKKFVMFIANLGDTLTIKTLDLIVKGLQLLEINPFVLEHHMNGTIFALEGKLLLAERVMSSFAS